jgi:hypothetical protein
LYGSASQVFILSISMLLVFFFLLEKKAPKRDSEKLAVLELAHDCFRANRLGERD